MAGHNDPGDQPWYRTPTATFTAGGVGAILLAILVVSVVQLSDDWSQPQTTVFTTEPVATTATTDTGNQQPFVITPSDTSSSSFPTSVSVSTSDFGLPTDTTSGTETTSSTDATTSVTASEDGDNQSTTTRKRPRLNQTRTGVPPN